MILLSLLVLTKRQVRPITDNKKQCGIFWLKLYISVGSDQIKTIYILLQNEVNYELDDFFFSLLLELLIVRYSICKEKKGTTAVFHFKAYGLKKINHSNEEIIPML